jgi:tetratricopeptide (TPR) repeat protein
LGAAQQAQRLNDNLPEVHFSLGNVYHASGKTAEAIIELKRALQLAPNSDDGYRGLGKAYLTLGQKEQALQAYQKAVDINTYYWVNHNSIGLVYSQLGEYNKADATTNSDLGTGIQSELPKSQGICHFVLCFQ